MLLKDKVLQKELKENGFIVIPFLSAEQLQQLNDFYTKVNGEQGPPDFIDGIHMTIWCTSGEYKTKVESFLQQFFKESTEKYFENTRQLNQVFIVKKPGKETTFKVHQDWNVIDETKYESVNVWIPLHDVDETSGALWVLKGSHNIARKIRGAGYLFPDYTHLFKQLENGATSVKLRAGEAMVFYHSTIHGSPPNMAFTDRKAACFSVIPKTAPLCIYYQPTATDSLMQYEPEDNFVFQYDYLRTESMQRPPAKVPVKISPTYINKPIEFKEVEPFLKRKKSIFSFFSK